MNHLISYNESTNRIVLECPECERELRIEYNPLGGELNCPYCSAINEVPDQEQLNHILAQASTAAPLSEPSLEELISDDDSSEEVINETAQVEIKKSPGKKRIKSKRAASRSKRPRRQAQKSSSPLAKIVLVLFLAVGFGAWFFLKDKDTGNALSKKGELTEVDKGISENSELVSQHTSTTNSHTSTSSQALIPRLEKATYIPKVAKPNVVFVCAEGISTDWLSAYKGKESTPNIERLAENGLLFKTVWMQAHETSSHTSILSGQYPSQHGVYQSESKAKFSPEKAWTSRLTKQGWACAFFGKWPFAENWTQQSFGFSTHGEKASQSFDFMKNQGSKPFVLYVNFPLDKNKAYTSSVRDLDRFMGELQANLIKNKVYKKTVLIFTSDGASKQVGQFAFKVSKRPSGVKAPEQARANRHKLNDLGVSVPLIISAPFLIPKNGYYTTDLVDSSDFFPTIKELCGLRISNHQIDGRSFVKTLSGDLNPLTKRSWIFSESKNEKMIRDWEYVYYNDKKYFGLKYDPLQSHNLNKIRHNDKLAGARDRLKMLMKRVGS